MSNKIHITYLVDPLCGWCYGAFAVLDAICALSDVEVAFAPTGLFAGSGARSVDAEFAAYAWSNDERIGALTGQRFTEDYRNQVLAKGGMMDSGPATLALTAVVLTMPSRERDALRLIQEGRYVSGRDITDMSTLRNILEEAGLGAASGRLAEPDAALLAANRQRMATARSLMMEFHVNGVPALIVDDGQRRGLIKANELFGNTDIAARILNFSVKSLETDHPSRAGKNHSVADIR